MKRKYKKRKASDIVLLTKTKNIGVIFLMKTIITEEMRFRQMVVKYASSEE